MNLHKAPLLRSLWVAGVAPLCLPSLAAAQGINLPLVPITIPLPIPIQTPNVSSINNTLGQVCGLLQSATGTLTAAQQDLQAQCNFLANPASPTGALSAAYTAIVGQQINALGPQAKQFASLETDSLFQRLMELRHGPDDLSGLNLRGDDSQLLAADGTPVVGSVPGSQPTFLDGRLGIFVNGSVESGSKDGTQNSFAFGIHNSNVTVGADYRITDSLVAGVAYAGDNTSVKFADNLGRLDLRENGVSLYGSWYKGDFYLDVLAGWGLSSLDSTRNVQFDNTDDGTQIDQQAFGSTHLHHLWAGLSIGDELSWHAFSLTPEVSVTFRQVRMDSYTETMSKPTAAGSGLALTYGNTTVPSLQARAGLRAGYTLSTPLGVLQPQLHGAFVRELRDAASSFTASFAAAASLGGDEATPIDLQTDRPQAHYFVYGAGLSATFARGFSAFFDYEELGSDGTLRSHSLALGVRYQPGS